MSGSGCLALDVWLWMSGSGCLVLVVTQPQSRIPALGLRIDLLFPRPPIINLARRRHNPL